jgi:hypothetical protein
MMWGMRLLGLVLAGLMSRLIDALVKYLFSQ